MGTRTNFVDAMGVEVKQALLAALGYMARVDSRLSPEEVTFIKKMGGALELEVAPVLEEQEGVTLESVLAPIVEEKEQRAVVMELVRLAHVDQCFSMDELVVIEEIATSIFGMDEHTLEAIKDWASRDVEHQKAAYALIEYGG